MASFVQGKPHFIRMMSASNSPENSFRSYTLSTSANIQMFASLSFHFPALQLTLAIKQQSRQLFQHFIPMKRQCVQQFFMVILMCDNFVVRFRKKTFHLNSQQQWSNAKNTEFCAHERTTKIHFTHSHGQLSHARHDAIIKMLRNTNNRVYIKEIKKV